MAAVITISPFYGVQTSANTTPTGNYERMSKRNHHDIGGFLTTAAGEHHDYAFVVSRQTVGRQRLCLSGQFTSRAILKPVYDPAGHEVDVSGRRRLSEEIARK